MFNNKHEHKDALISSLQSEVEHLRQENHRLTQRLKKTEILVDIHREASQILIFMLDTRRANTSGIASRNFDDSINCLARQILSSKAISEPIQTQQYIVQERTVSFT